MLPSVVRVDGAARLLGSDYRPVQIVAAPVCVFLRRPAPAKHVVHQVGGPCASVSARSSGSVARRDMLMHFHNRAQLVLDECLPGTRHARDDDRPSRDGPTNENPARATLQESVRHPTTCATRR